MIERRGLVCTLLQRYIENDDDDGDDDEDVYYDARATTVTRSTYSSTIIEKSRDKDVAIDTTS